MKYETTNWFKCFDVDEEGKLLSPTEWKVTLKNGLVYKSSKWSKAYEDNKTQQGNGDSKN